MPIARTGQMVAALDEAILRRLARWHRPRVTSVMKALTRLGDGPAWALLALVLIGAGGAATALGLRVGLAALAATALAYPLKRLCRRSRPCMRLVGFEALVESPDAFSFPSGHTCAAFAVAVAAMPAPPPVAFSLLAVAAGIATSRVYLGAHYPADVMAGMVLGSAVGGVVLHFAA